MWTPSIPSPIPMSVPPGRRAWTWALVLAMVCLSLAGCGKKSTAVDTDDDDGKSTTEVSPKQVKNFCGHCHAYPPPETFPKADWANEIQRGYDFYESSGLTLKTPPFSGVVKYYEKRAPLKLQVLPDSNVKGPCPIQFSRQGIRNRDLPPYPSISHLSLVHLSDNKKLDILVCEMRYGLILQYKPYDPKAGWKVLGKVTNPAHAEVVDLDGDGIKDILVADLGNFKPTDSRVGSVVWLRGRKNGTYQKHVLLDKVGRVADVQAGFFRNKKQKDLVVAAFGWTQTGEIIFLKNETTNWDKPKFRPRILDDRHGAIHVPTVDLNKDGKLDFVALISQEHETIVAFLNQGNGNFKKKTIFTASHPAYGSSGIQLVDMNGDGKMDVLYTNGDVLDSYLLKPYHGIQWLENKGKFPFTHHPVTNMYGVHRAIAVNIGDKKTKDIFAVSFLPIIKFPQRKPMNLDAVILLEQKLPGKFARHSLEKVLCNSVTCDFGDLFGDGRQFLVIGSFCATEDESIKDFVQIWEVKK